MRWTFGQMDAVHARTIAAWRYEPPYDFYNPSADPSSLLDPKFRYYAVTDQGGDLVGFCCYGADARVPGGDYPAGGALDVGVGLRPDCTGRGLGFDFLSAVLAWGRSEFAPQTFRATVATFNRRSISVCERAGFRPVKRFNSDASGMEFVVLSLPAQGAEQTPPPAHTPRGAPSPSPSSPSFAFRRSLPFKRAGFCRSCWPAGRNNASPLLP